MATAAVDGAEARASAGPARAAEPYRADVDGLRGVAVLLVVVHHAAGAALPGGFVGVDVFFVISGYLITRLLRAELAAGAFSALGFYERRVRRLAPALLFMLAATTAAGWFVLMPRAFEAYAASLVATVPGLSNVHFWRETADYFAPAAETMPLLHTWSLAVEEQFYLFFPWFLLLLGRHAGAATVAALLLSFGLAAWMAQAAPTPAFYLPVTRAWELLLGALVALGAERDARLRGAAAEVAGWVGLAAVSTAALLLGPETRVPGAAVLLPCGGAALLLAGGGGTGAGRLLAARPLVAVGLLSYSLYLWHWPVLALLRARLASDALTPGWTAGALALSFALAWASWRFVERPVRERRALRTRRALFAACGAGAAALLAAGLLIGRADGAPSRFPGFAAFALPDRPQAGLAMPCSLPELARDPARCGGAGKPRALLWGDSFARHYGPALRERADRGELPFALAMDSRSGCLPLMGFDARRKPACRPWADGVAERAAAAGVELVIVSGRWEGQGERLRYDLLDRTIRRLRGRGLRVAVVGPTPAFSFARADEHHYRRLRAGLAAAERDVAPDGVPAALRARLRATAERAGAGYFDPTPALCGAGGCPYRDGGRYLFGETSHLTVDGARRVAARLAGSDGVMSTSPQRKLGPPSPGTALRRP